MRRKHFTLIELLVVIAIIAILAAILLPALQAARERAKGAGCISNMKTMSIVSRQYLDDSKNFWPGINNRTVKASWMRCMVQGKYIGGPRNDDEALAKYDFKEYRCPSIEFRPSVGTANMQVYGAPYHSGSGNVNAKPGTQLDYKDTRYSDDGGSSWKYDRKIPLSSRILFGCSISRSNDNYEPWVANCIMSGLSSTTSRGEPTDVHNGRFTICTPASNVTQLSADSMGDYYVYYNLVWGTNSHSFTVKARWYLPAGTDTPISIY